MSFYVPTKPGNIRKQHMTGAEQRRRLNTLKEEKKSFFANGELCSQVSICRMPRPVGKIYRG